MNTGYNGRVRFAARTRRGAIGIGASGLLLAGLPVLVLSLAHSPAGQRAGPAAHARLTVGPAAAAAPAVLRTAVQRTADSSGASTGSWGSGSSRRSGSAVDATGSPRAVRPGQSGGNQAGFSVAISGATAVVAAPGTSQNAGSAYIRERSRGRWHRAATLPDPRGAIGDEYAWSVAISSSKAGTYAAIGGNNYNGDRDVVYVYKGSGKTWHLQAKIGDPGSTFQDMFGDALAMNSSTLVVSASCRENNTGGVYIYGRSGASWKLQASLTNPAGNVGDKYGFSVAISGSTVVVGAINVAYAYTREPGKGWRETARLTNPGPADGFFGTSVAVLGSAAVIGAPGDPAEGINLAGAAYVYRISGTRLSRTQRLTAPPHSRGDAFGNSIAMTSKNILIGMPLYGTSKCGTAYAFRPSGGRWRLQAQVRNPHCTAGDQFGYAVALSGTSGAIGAPYANGNAGASYELTLP